MEEIENVVDDVENGTKTISLKRVREIQNVSPSCKAHPTTIDHSAGLRVSCNGGLNVGVYAEDQRVWHAATTILSVCTVHL